MLKGLFLLEQQRFYSTDLQPNILSHSNQSNMSMSNVSNLYVQFIFDNDILSFQDTNINAQQPSNFFSPIYINNMIANNVQAFPNDNVHMGHVGENDVQ